MGKAEFKAFHPIVPIVTRAVCVCVSCFSLLVVPPLPRRTEGRYLRDVVVIVLDLGGIVWEKVRNFDAAFSRYFQLPFVEVVGGLLLLVLWFSFSLALPSCGLIVNLCVCVFVSASRPCRKR